MKAARNAAPPASGTRGAAVKAASDRRPQGRFDAIQIPRFHTEVNVPGYDVQTAIAQAQKRKKKERSRAERVQREKEHELAKQAEPVVLGAPPSDKGSECEQFTIAL